jgi:hypothetical protein
MTNDPPKRTAKPAPNHVALVVRRHLQRSFGFEVDAEVVKRQTGNHFLSVVLNGFVTVIPRIRLKSRSFSVTMISIPSPACTRDERIPKRRPFLAHEIHRVHNRFFATVEYTPFRGTKNLSNDVLSLTAWHRSRDFLSGNGEKLAQILQCCDATARLPNRQHDPACCYLLFFVQPDICVDQHIRIK